MKKIAADWVFPVSGPPVKNGVLIADERTGEILQIDTADKHDPSSLDKRKGVLVPGFVNAHCHLELSHMRNVADTGTGLIAFLHKVVNFRNVSQEEILDAIDRADQEMQKEGIVAVGDISNRVDTAACKAKSPIRYYTFVEMFDFMQGEKAHDHFNNFSPSLEAHKANGKNQKSCVPHAPYTVSPALFELIDQQNEGEKTISIHMQETEAENEFFQSKTGGMLEFFEDFGFSIDHISPIQRPSIWYALQHMNPAHRTLFVHNTLTTPQDIEAAKIWSDKIYWATCPNANLYIENRLPRYQNFMEAGVKMTIGTDSLTSNWQLSILEEMKTITQYQSFVSFEEVLRWATLNGAEALGFNTEIGSFDPGKTPGINLIEQMDGLHLTRASRVVKIL